MPGHRGQDATGGTRKPTRRDDVNDWCAPYDAPPSLVALLRSIWAKRAHLSVRERDMVHQWLARIQHGPLSAAQIETAAAIGRSVGVGYDDPTYDSPSRVPAVAAQPWGPLPLKPPGRA